MSDIDKKDIKNIEQLENILNSKKINKIKIKKGEYEIEITKESNEILNTENKTISQNIKKPNNSEKNKEEFKKENIVTSPMVGVAYLSPDPEKPAYVKEGQHVKQGDTLLLIEAMKTFNEIKAPKSGVIKKIVCLNSQPVEFGETLLVFE
ncbi:MAG: Biotin carboxyl carrier protein of acetyl-CoA carboxylase [Alphaproteobacteria bacterium MarineAlpha5_Bin9]|nr:MAG: Biotin carboxyl carrier protein of acetyl-CoA carboxylase [Alphaproteobacteria bacterium MarineAlpha5_Bin9]|tara:strand:+ start:24135 stop:24584 length:450 start_codon:yes stop_codon:yes gene_type:complete